MEILRKIASVGPNREALTIKLVVISTISSIGYLQYGYSFWVSTIIFERMKLLHNIHSNTTEQRSEMSLYMVMSKLAVFVFAIGGILGCFCTGPLLDGYGRKTTLIINSLLSIISAFIMGYSNVVDRYAYTLFSCFLSGVCSGIGSCAIPIYIGELSPSSVRGAIICFVTLAFAVGTSMAQFLTQIKSIASHEGLAFLMIISGSLSAVGFVTMPFFPESPRFLLIQKGNEEKATEALKKLRGTADVEEEIEDMNQEDIIEKAEKGMGLCKLMCFQGLRWHIISLVVLIVGQQFSGISVTYIIDSVGRRKVLLLGLGINSFFCVLLTMSLELQSSAPWMSYISTCSVFIFLIGQNIGPGPVPNVLMVEIFLQSSRTSACVFGKGFQWLLSLIKTIVFYFIQSFFGTYIFLVFWPICTATLIYVFKMIPETKQMSFVAIRREMAIQIGKTIKGRSGQQFRRRSTQSSLRGRAKGRRKTMKR
ncbi:solute carrier family 2, facilitated glucose transporter member 5-like isoform X2 [Hemicordylus capensis]|uniref:solute carrier family 2, facilitated glucose transporter member 5-like isoform X2 n=1 Tax=Hemicordylus capensis TaxID=884348 RepID=UPI00230292F7|nr:solute carrier family 2, facilitated glucose transporter member 5-like isoform X2 [Hemicordylus capensis]